MFKVIISHEGSSAFSSPTYNIIGKISAENLMDLGTVGGDSAVKNFVCGEVLDAIAKRDDIMDLENINIEEKWTEFKKLMTHPLLEPGLAKIFEEMGLITAGTDIGGNYVKLTQKGIETE